MSDGEKGIGGEPTKAWLEENPKEPLPIVPAEGSRHTQYGIVDIHSRALRGVLHRVDASLVERKIGTSAEELWALEGSELVEALPATGLKTLGVSEMKAGGALPEAVVDKCVDAEHVGLMNLGLDVRQLRVGPTGEGGVGRDPVPDGWADLGHPG